MEVESNVCRVCLTSTQSCLSLFTANGIELNIASILNQYLWFEVKKDDQYSLLCTDCWQHVEQWHLFYQRIKDVHFLCDFPEAKVSTDVATLVKDDNTDNGNETEVKTETDPSAELDSLLTSNVLVKIENHSSDEDADPIYNDDDSTDDSCSSIGYKAKKSIKSKRLRGKYKKKPAKEGKPIKYEPNLEVRAQRLATQADEDQKIREFFKLECKLCDATDFNRFLEVKAHYREHHSLKRGYIACCKKKFTRRGGLLEHMMRHTNPDAFRCTICQKIFNDRSGLKLHMHHHASSDQKIYKCDTCDKGFSLKYHLLQHLLKAHLSDEQKAKQKIHKCNQCDAAFAIPSILQGHIRSVHQNANMTICDICAKVFKSKLQCQRHLLDQHINANRPKIQCVQCGAWLKTEHSLQSHMRRTHSESTQTCPLCGKLSPNKDALRTHMKYVHEGKRPFKCTLCDKAFKKSLPLKEHMASHTGTVLYTCTYCPKTFNSNANKHSHRKKAHPEEWLRDRTTMGPRRGGVATT